LGLLWSLFCGSRVGPPLLFVSLPSTLHELLLLKPRTMDSGSITNAPRASRALSCPPVAPPRRLRAPSLPLDLAGVPVAFLVPAPSARAAALPPAPPVARSLAVELFEMAADPASSPASSPGLFVTPGPVSPSSASGSAGAVQLTPWEQVTAGGGPVPSAKRQRTFDLMKAVEETGVERSPSSACALCSSVGARCFVSGVTATLKCSYCVYKALPCSVVSSSLFCISWLTLV
jgi:hypothetical protein